MSHCMRKGKRREEGFTLIELVIVMAIMAILVVIAIPSYITARQSATISASKSNLRNLAMALRLYTAENNLNVYPPETGTGGINDVLPTYLPGGAPKNPAGKNYVYAQTGTPAGASFLIGDPDNYGTDVYYQVGPAGSIQEVTFSSSLQGL
mgnify:CR=1 FL=1